ncbi:MAG: thermonuclease family protein [Acetobacter sp.]|nr:thermonuclease family protein [Acetobacter sp.]
MLLKRIICGVVAAIFIIGGMALFHTSQQLWLAIGFCVLIGGITLAYIAIKQHLPNYSFWITLIALGLAYALYTTHLSPVSEEEQQMISSRLEKEIERSKDFLDNEAPKGKKKRTSAKREKNSTGFNLNAYPKITGSATVVHAHIFYIGGRYIRLYGVDAPDTDQVCSNAMGHSYNCGEEAASWVRGWIDQNPIDCYILKVDPNGQNLATCIWGEYDIGAALVGAGWGLANTRETTIYQPYEVKAQSESSGLWQGSFYTPEDWRDIKRGRNDFTIKKKALPQSDGFFSFGSLF